MTEQDDTKSADGHDADPAIVELAVAVLKRDPRGVARAISLVEDRRSAAEPRLVELLRRLSRARDPLLCHRVGVTGPPGVGKSSLVSALGKVARVRGLSVGILAVDPSSPRSGGALLGDRARMEIDPNDAGLYMRSMASGGDLGGLARAAGAAIDVLSAAYDLVLTETTGVGQSETDIEHVADTVVMVVQPGSGDVLQFLKAGIIEIPDLFVVNKADLGTIAQRAMADLGAALNAVHAGTAVARPDVIATSVSAGSGIEELLDAIQAHRKQLDESGQRRLRRQSAAAAWALRLCTQRFGDYGVERAGGRAALRAWLRGEIERGATAVEAVAGARAICVGS